MEGVLDLVGTEALCTGLSCGAVATSTNQRGYLGDYHGVPRRFSTSPEQSACRTASATCCDSAYMTCFPFKVFG